MIFACGRCKRSIVADPESCWLCLSELCYDCWDEHGHCGHEQADLINEYGALAFRGIVPALKIDDLLSMSLEQLRTDIEIAKSRRS